MTARIAALFVVLLAGAFAGCTGPRPEVVRYDLRPPEQPGDPYVMIVTVENTGRGDGQIEVTARLTAPESGVVVAEDSKTVQITGHATIEVAIELHPATDGPFVEEAEVHYPP